MGIRACACGVGLALHTADSERFVPLAQVRNRQPGKQADSFLSSRMVFFGTIGIVQGRNESRPGMSGATWIHLFLAGMIQGMERFTRPDSAASASGGGRRQRPRGEARGRQRPGLPASFLNTIGC